MLNHIKYKEVIWGRQHSFTEGKLYLTNLVTFCGGLLTTAVIWGRLTDVIYQDFCNFFNTVPNDTLFSKLQRHGFDGWTVQWLRNGLGGCNQRVVYNGSMSRWRLLMSCVPQGSVLGLMINIFINNIDNRIIECTFSTFAGVMRLRSAVDTTKKLWPTGQEREFYPSPHDTSTGVLHSHLGCSVQDKNLLQQVQRAVKWLRSGAHLLQIQAEITDVQTGKEKASGRFHYSLALTIRGLVERREREGLFIQADSDRTRCNGFNLKEGSFI